MNIDLESLTVDEIFSFLIAIGLFLLFLGILIYFLYLKPKKDREERERKRREEEARKKTKPKEVDERIKKNQKYWKEVAEYMNIIDEVNKKE